LIAVRIEEPDGNAHAVYIDSLNTVKDAFREIAKRLDLLNTEDYGLYEVNYTIDRCTPLRMRTYLCDIFSSWEKIEKQTNSIFSLQIRRKIFLSPRYQESILLSDPCAARIQFLQLVEDFRKGRLLLSKEECAKPAAILYKYWCIEFSKSAQNVQKNHFESILPFNYISAFTSKQDLFEKLDKEFFLVTEDTQPACGFAFMRALSTFNSFGSVVFTVTQAKHSHSKVWLVITCLTVSIHIPQTVEPITSWTFNDITNWNADTESFQILVGSLMKQERRIFQTLQAAEIADLFTHYWAAYQKEKRKSLTLTRKGY